jgi:hypothetical protein
MQLYEGHVKPEGHMADDTVYRSGTLINTNPIRLWGSDIFCAF